MHAHLYALRRYEGSAIPLNTAAPYDCNVTWVIVSNHAVLQVFPCDASGCSTTPYPENLMTRANGQMSISGCGPFKIVSNAASACSSGVSDAATITLTGDHSLSPNTFDPAPLRCGQSVQLPRVVSSCGGNPVTTYTVQLNKMAAPNSTYSLTTDGVFAPKTQGTFSVAISGSSACKSGPVATVQVVASETIVAAKKMPDTASCNTMFQLPTYTSGGSDVRTTYQVRSH